MPETVVIRVVDARLSVEPLDEEMDAAYRRGFGAGLALAIHVDRLRCGQCGDDLLPGEIEGHLASEGRLLA